MRKNIWRCKLFSRLTIALLLVWSTLLLHGCGKVHNLAILEPVLVGISAENAVRITGLFRRAVKTLMQEDMKRSQVMGVPRRLAGTALLSPETSNIAVEYFFRNRHHELRKLFNRNPLAKRKFTAILMVRIEPAARSGFFQVESCLMNLETGGVFTFMPGLDGLVVPRKVLISDAYWNFELRRLCHKLMGD